MDPFATVEDYRERYPDDTTSDETLLAALMDATDVISAAMDGADIDYTDPSESFTARLSRICKTVVRRAIGSASAGDVPFGATQISETAAQFSASAQFANPYGDMFLTTQERESLGIGVGGACVISPYG